MKMETTSSQSRTLLHIVFGIAGNQFRSLQARSESKLAGVLETSRDARGCETWTALFNAVLQKSCRAEISGCRWPGLGVQRASTMLCCLPFAANADAISSCRSSTGSRGCISLGHAGFCLNSD